MRASQIELILLSRVSWASVASLIFNIASAADANVLKRLYTRDHQRFERKKRVGSSYTLNMETPTEVLSAFFFWFVLFTWLQTREFLFFLNANQVALRYVGVKGGRLHRPTNVHASVWLRTTFVDKRLTKIDMLSTIDRDDWLWHPLSKSPKPKGKWAAGRNERKDVVILVHFINVRIKKK